ncbi:MAG: chemotaxis protein CheW, partial [Planctomycetes bacterium]|nr:chemotaxis protein CheW [Planctomycetota bacterium]
MSAVFEEQPDELLRWVTFRLADEGYGINVMQVQEVLRITDVAPVPGAPHFVLGIINLRGNVVTVLDMRKLLGLMPGEVTEQSRIMVIESGKVTVGL